MILQLLPGNAGSSTLRIYRLRRIVEKKTSFLDTKILKTSDTFSVSFYKTAMRFTVSVATCIFFSSK